MFLRLLLNITYRRLSRPYLGVLIVSIFYVKETIYSEIPSGDNLNELDDKTSVMV